MPDIFHPDSLVIETCDEATGERAFEIAKRESANRKPDLTGPTEFIEIFGVPDWYLQSVNRQTVPPERGSGFWYTIVFHRVRRI